MVDAALDDDARLAIKGPRKRRKMLLIIGVAATVAFGGAGGAYFSGALDSLFGGNEAAEAGDTAHDGSSDAGHGDTGHGDTGHGADEATSGHGGSVDGGGAQGDMAAVEPGHYYDLPEFIVNMNTPGERRRFLRLRARLDVADPRTIDRVEALMPRIVDGFQVYLRELRPTDLAGSAGTFRLREELLRRVNYEIAPASADDLLFVEVVVQ